MRWFDKLRLRLRSLFRPRSVELELDKELRFHLDQQIQENIAAGMTANDARRATLRSIGGLDQFKEQCRDERRTNLVYGAFQDFRYACHMIVRKPGFTIVAILTLALGIGANTAIFSIADAVLFRPLPYADPERVFIFQGYNRQTGDRFTSVPDEYFRIIDARHSGLGEVGFLRGAPSLVVETGAGVQAIFHSRVSANYFDILGVRPARGRMLRAGDEPGRSAVLAYAAWRQRFGGEEDIIGRSVRLGAGTFNIVGVLPADFIFPTLFNVPEIVTLVEPTPRSATEYLLWPIARLEAGVSREQAQAEIEALVAPIAALDPRNANSFPILDDVRSVLYPVGRDIMRLLLAASLCVLLVGCSYLANIALVENKAREREVGMRMALGASRLRLVRPLVFQAAVISLAGAVLAVVATTAVFDTLLRQVPTVAYGNAPVGVGWRVLVFALGLGVLSSIAFSLGPRGACPAGIR